VAAGGRVLSYPHALPTPRQRPSTALVHGSVHAVQNRGHIGSGITWALAQALRHQLEVVQRPEASQAMRSSAPWKSSRASARDSSCSSGRDWMRAVVASLRGPQRRASWRRVSPARRGCGASAPAPPAAVGADWLIQASGGGGGLDMGWEDQVKPSPLMGNDRGDGLKPKKDQYQGRASKDGDQRAEPHSEPDRSSPT
jgi:hypothetical protein